VALSRCRFGPATNMSLPYEHFVPAPVIQIGVSGFDALLWRNLGGASIRILVIYRLVVQ
jgi:hypothetical protein